MAEVKIKTQYICSECGATFMKWSGKCQSCGTWNSLSEEAVEQTAKGKKSYSPVSNTEPTSLSQLTAGTEIRYHSGFDELNRVLGGGIVKGSLILLGGDPGIGKSTLLLQMCGRINKAFKALYISGEESAGQIKLRADRLGINSENIYILSETNAESIVAAIEKMKPSLVIVDSIQTIYTENASTSAGSVSQIKESAAVLMRCAKTNEIPVFLVGHVTKEGNIAGPKVLEHTVDVVLYFEGDEKTQYRILRSAKNRFGTTSEIGVFEMRSDGLGEIKNPSAEFISDSQSEVSGTVIGCLFEGSRPILCELQSLVSKSPFPSPRRMAIGADYGRLCMLIAVLEKRAGLLLYDNDVYLNVAGGLSLNETSADLAVILSLASCVKDFVIGNDTVIIGEVGLSGEVRGVSNIDVRLSEAYRLGFKKAVVPAKCKITATLGDMEIIRVRNVREAIRFFL
ncbi:MAG: DNA repair protein RadA [Clostridia bacterium]|nr:DNA repair protein RadA [Clostridia bacterium]